MQEESNNNLKISVLLLILIVVAGYLLVSKSPIGDREEALVVNKLMPVNGVIALPSEFPSDIPVEKDLVLESVTTYYPKQNAKQLSVSYQSDVDREQKYNEYKNYMTSVGYEMKGEQTNSFVKAIFGVRENSNLSIAISSLDDRTIVQLSYLLKSLK